MPQIHTDRDIGAPIRSRTEMAGFVDPPVIPLLEAYLVFPARFERASIQLRCSEVEALSGTGTYSGDPYGIRTRISNVRGCRPKPLDEWTILFIISTY